MSGGVLAGLLYKYIFQVQPITRGTNLDTERVVTRHFDAAYTTSREYYDDTGTMTTSFTRSTTLPSTLSRSDSMVRSQTPRTLNYCNRSTVSRGYQPTHVRGRNHNHTYNPHRVSFAGTRQQTIGLENRAYHDTKLATDYELERIITGNEGSLTDLTKY